MPRTRQPYLDRFWQKVVQGDGCWGWSAATDKDGYGLLTIGAWEPGTGKSVMVRSHRVSWEIHNGPIPAGLWVLHRCDNPPCSNPADLYLGTVVENGRDRRERRSDLRVVQCQNGHDYTPENTLSELRNGHSYRRCRTCHNRLSMESYYRGGRDRRKARRSEAETCPQ